MKNSSTGTPAKWPTGLHQASRTSGAARNVGSALPPTLRTQMEAQMGTDFSDVRIHTNSAVVSDGIGARAFTIGNDIYFNAGEYNPATGAGRHLLAHELTHVVQQRKPQ